MLQLTILAPGTREMPGVFNKTIILLRLAGNKVIYNQRGCMCLIGYLTLHITCRII